MERYGTRHNVPVGSTDPRLQFILLALFFAFFTLAFLWFVVFPELVP